MKISVSALRSRTNSFMATTALATVVALSSVGCDQPLSPTSPTLNRVAGVGSGANRMFATSAADTKEVPLKGSLDGTFTFVPEAAPSTFAAVRLDVVGVGSRLGQFTLVAPHRVNLATNPAEGSGSFELVAANGDTLTGRLQGLGPASLRRQTVSRLRRPIQSPEARGGSPGILAGSQRNARST